MAEWLTKNVAVVLMYVGGLPALPIFHLLYEDRHKPGVIWFLAVVGTASVWAFLYASFTLVRSPSLTLALANFFWVTVPTVAVCLFLLSYEYVFRTVASRRLVLFLFTPIGVLFVLSWINPNNLVFTSEYHVGPAGVLHVPPLGGPVRILVTQVYGFLLTLLAAGMFTGEALRTRGVQRRQTLSLLLIFVALAATTLLKIGEVVPEYFDPTSLAFTVSGLAFAYSIERHGLLKYTPVARERAFEAVGEALVVVDPDGIIVDTNSSAHQLFGDEIIGDPVESALPDPSPGGPSETIPTVQLESPNGPRYFSWRTSRIAYGRGLTGTLVVLSDITEMKQRQDELGLLTQILTRIFRHNMRNDLNIIGGYASDISEASDDRVVEMAEHIQAQTRKLLEKSEKARELATLFQPQDQRQVALRTEVERVLAPFRDRPEVIVRSRLDDVPATVHPNMGLALDELIENAITHQVSPEPTEIRVSTTVTDAHVVLTIEDNGPGIPDTEREVLDASRETSLRHSSGIGLWLVKLIVSRLDGHLEIDSGTNGTRVEIRLPRNPAPPGHHT